MVALDFNLKMLAAIFLKASSFELSNLKSHLRTEKSCDLYFIFSFVGFIEKLLVISVCFDSTFECRI
jgi:hypothetical protein